jgi:hypothetical protein
VSSGGGSGAEGKASVEVKASAASPAEFSAAAGADPEATLARDLVWRPNDFPYALPAGCQHHVVWGLRMPLLSEVEAYARARLPRDSETIVLFNPPHLQSVKVGTTACLQSRHSVSALSGCSACTRIIAACRSCGECRCW